MVGLSELVANELLRRCAESLAANAAGYVELEMAQSICFEERDNPAVMEQIEKYTALADEITDGLFSATLQSWSATKQ